MTADKLYGAPVVYLMIGMRWMYTYGLVDYYYPRAFALFVALLIARLAGVIHRRNGNGTDMRAKTVRHMTFVTHAHFVRFLMLIALVAAIAQPAFAQGGDVTIFAGYAFPTYSETFTSPLPSIPTLPGIELTPDGDFVLEARGGLVFAGAAAFELGGFFALEGRLDSTGIELQSSGVRYTINGGGLGGSISLGAGDIPVDRLNMLSLNIRLRTPGPVAFYASGGLSYLPSFSIGGSIPLVVEIPGLPIPAIEVPVSFRVAPTESSYRFGVNAGAGLRFPIAPKVSLVAEGRVFYFRDYELVAEVPDLPVLGDPGDFRIVTFEPVVVNAIGGIAIRF